MTQCNRMNCSRHSNLVDGFSELRRLQKTLELADGRLVPSVNRWLHPSKGICQDGQVIHVACEDGVVETECQNNEMGIHDIVSACERQQLPDTSAVVECMHVDGLEKVSQARLGRTCAPDLRNNGVSRMKSGSRATDDLSVPFISAEDLLTNKRAVARPQDLADVAALETRPGPDQ